MALSKEMLNKMSDLIIAGFALVAALAWNEAIQNGIKSVLDTGKTFPSQLTYAVVVTIIAVVVTVWMGHIVKRK